MTNPAIKKMKILRSVNMQKFAFTETQVEAENIDRDAGIIRAVSIISYGPALGHGVFVDETSLETVIEAIGENRLPAYITHSGAIFEDRLIREIGYFDNFRKDDKQIRADFHAFESFKNDESAKFNRLFELAETMPNRFGLSIVCSGLMAWATTEGDMPLGDNPDDRPENAIYADPSIRVIDIDSADFVDKPAANATGLFSKIDKPKKTMTKAELEEQLKQVEIEKSELQAQVVELNQRITEQDEAIGKYETEIEDAKSKLGEAGNKSELAEKALQELNEAIAEKDTELQAANDALSVVKAENAELQESLQSITKDRDQLLDDLKGEVDQVAKLKAIIDGNAPLKAQDEDDDGSKVLSKQERDVIISNYAKEHKISEAMAVLRLGREQPQIFKRS